MTFRNIKLIVGLGNPEQKYINNRHNIGYKVIDSLIDKYFTWPHHKFYDNFFQGQINIAYKQLLILLKPKTGMNDSGISVAKVLKELNINSNEILIVYDDLSLPFGTIRLKHKGTSGGHNGLKSIIHELKTEDFSRLKIGIGNTVIPTQHTEMLNIKDYVLSDFTESKDRVNKVIRASESFITSLLSERLTSTFTFTVDFTND